MKTDRRGLLRTILCAPAALLMSGNVKAKEPEGYVAGTVLEAIPAPPTQHIEHLHVTVNVQGSVIHESQLEDVVKRALVGLQKKGRI